MNFFKVTMILTLVLPGMMFASSAPRGKDTTVTEQLRALMQPSSPVTPKKTVTNNVGSTNTPKRSDYTHSPKSHR